VGSLLKAFWIWLCKSESVMALMLPLEFWTSGLWGALTLPATPPVVEGAVELGDTGVPDLLCAPSPIWFAGVLGLIGGVCGCCAVWPVAKVTDKANPKPRT
jgi:hypothetical protein